jgi:hypothetical protein
VQDPAQIITSALSRWVDGELISESLYDNVTTMRSLANYNGMLKS